MHTCYVCEAEDTVEKLNLGLQPISNRFLKAQGESEFHAPLGISQCNECGLVQITQPFPLKEIQPLYDWITYNEPEVHLDHVANVIEELPGLTPQSNIWGVSFKDNSLLNRLERKGFENLYQLDPGSDLDIELNGAGVETIQNKITGQQMAKAAEKYGNPHVIIARHITEHAYDLRRFVSSLLSVLSPQGYIILEVPDCQRAFESIDITTIWEEHTIYFTPQTFFSMFRYFNLDLVFREIYPNAFENSLVGIGRTNSMAMNIEKQQDNLQPEFERIQNYVINYSIFSQKLKEYFKTFNEQEGKIALFGAGHLACAFINFFGVKDYLSFVVDDNPHKQGMFMPASGLPIVPSSMLLTEDIKLCLFSLNPEVEEKVIKNQKSFIEKGGRFYSIFPASQRALKLVTGDEK